MFVPALRRRFTACRRHR